MDAHPTFSGDSNVFDSLPIIKSRLDYHQPPTHGDDSHLKIPRPSEKKGVYGPSENIVISTYETVQSGGFTMIHCYSHDTMHPILGR
jgi:hypothetical protein